MHPQLTTRPGGLRYAFLLRESDPRIAEAALATQKHALREELARRGGTIEDRHIFADAGFSGALLERPAIEALLDAAERHEIDVVLATEKARVSRGEPFAFYYVRRELARCRVRLEFLSGYTDDGQSEVGALVDGLEVLLPSIERRAITNRFRRGRDRVHAEGFHWASTPPYGYSYIPGGQKAGHWEKLEAEGRWVVQIFEWAAAGVSIEEIARRLNREEVPTKRGKRWYKSSVNYMLWNPIYKGLHAAGRQVSVAPKRAYVPRDAGNRRRREKCSLARTQDPTAWTATHEAPELSYVSAALWQRANDYREINRRTSPRRAKEPALLHGLVFCRRDHEGYGERAMNCVAGSPPKRYPLYRCMFVDGAGKGGHYCTGRARQDVIDAAVWARVRELVLDPARLLADMRAAWEGAVDRTRRAAQRRSAATAELEAAQAALDRADLDYYQHQLPEERYRRLLPALEAAVAKAQAALEDVAEGPAVLADHELLRLYEGLALDDPERFGERALARLDAMEPAERRAEIKRLVRRVVCDQDGWYIESDLARLAGDLDLGTNDRNR
jgi:DNA invertase Pin-like site-specific DNA recombinase